jgi:putative intracellular protease/amidase
MIPVRGVVRVPVVRQTLPPVETAALLYSNNPERVTRFGTLFVARMNPPGGGATRLLYHHQSAMDKAAAFTVELINDAESAAAVQVVGGGFGPVVDTVWVGYRAGSAFLRDVLADTGVVLEIPGRSRVALTAQRLAPGLTISAWSSCVRCRERPACWSGRRGHPRRRADAVDRAAAGADPVGRRGRRRGGSAGAQRTRLPGSRAKRSRSGTRWAAGGRSSGSAACRSGAAPTPSAASKATTAFFTTSS